MLMLAIILILHHRELLRDRLFFLYLVCYGSFRFLHEFVRDTPKPFLGLSGYQFMALGIAGLGAWMLRRRRQSLEASNR
jgi:phosphatidylglycerol---prolipoprotein diacylglyceryl transferase